MSLTLEIPEETIAAMRWPRGEVEGVLRKELAVAVYARGGLSIGKSVEFSGVTRRDFEAMLAERRIERPYSFAEIERDLASARQRAGLISS